MSNNQKFIIKKAILVVDDVELNRNIVNKIFGNTHLVLMAENGLDALEILHRQQVDIVLLDIQMPLMDGYEVIKAMKAESRLAEIPILVTTGAIDKSERKAFDLGADDYLTQPYDPYILRKRVENLVDRYELREMRHAAKENEKTVSMLEGLGIAYWEWTPEGGYHHSTEYEKYAISQLEDEKIWDPEAPFAYVHPDDIPLMKKFMQKYPDDEVKKSSVVRCKMHDGSYRWTELFSFAETSVDGKLLRLVSAMRDVDKEWIASRSVEQKNMELNHIIDSTSGGVATYRMSNGLQLLSMSDGMAKRLGYTPAEVEKTRNQDAMNYAHASDRKLLKEKAEECAKTGKPQIFAYRIAKRDGSYKWFRASIYAAGKSDGCPVFYVVFTDIAEVNADYVEALNQTNEMIFIADWESRDILYCNQAAADMAGMPISDLFGKKCSQIPHHCDKRCATCSQNQLTYDELLIRPEAVGKKYFLKKGKRILWNGREAFIEYAIDITAQHNMTEKTVFERNLLSAATRVMFPLCIISNLTQNIYNIVEYDNWIIKKAATEGRYDDLIEVGACTVPEEDRGAFVAAFSRENLYKVYAEKNKTVSLTHRQIGDDGVQHWSHTYVVFSDQLLNDDLYAMTFSLSVDEQKKAEKAAKDALKEAKHANMAKTAFLSRVSHDMRTPMNTIIGLTALSLDDNGITPELKINLNNIRGASEFLLGLVNDVLDMSKIDSGAVELKYEPYDYKEFLTKLKTMFEPQCKEKNITFDFENVVVSTVVMADRLRMDQVFFNILSNAIKFTPEGGKVSYRTENVVVDEERISADYIITDTGIGMSPEFLQHIFEPFKQEDSAHTSTVQGTGLGMSIAKHLVEVMGGTIRAESKQNVGTKVTVHLGFALCKNPESENTQQAETFDLDILKGKRILLAEDHPINAKIAQKILEKKGMLVVHASNGKITVNDFTASEPGYFDAILMDIRMPEMDGLEATRKIRSSSHPDAATIPIIAMSANAYDEDVNQSLEAGMNAHIAKPIDTAILYQTIANHL